jgi:hypothetical protein
MRKFALNVTAGTLSGLGCAWKFACCSLIFTITCWSGFFAAAGFTGFAGLVCATDGAAVADAAVAGVALAAVAGVGDAAIAAGVVVAIVFAAGVGLAVAVAGVAVAFGAAGAVTDLGAAGEALGDALALAAGAFLSFRLVAFSFLSGGVALAAGWSAELFISGAVLGVIFRVDGTFLSGLIAAGDSVTTGSFMGGASVFGACVVAGVSFRAGVSVLGARVGRGFTSVGGFFSFGFLLGDSSGVGCWAITAPASASEATISKLVNFFIMSLCWSLTEAIYSTQVVFRPAVASRGGGWPPGASIALTAIIRARMSTRLPLRARLPVARHRSAAYAAILSALPVSAWRNYPRSRTCWEILVASNSRTSSALLAVTGIRTVSVDCVCDSVTPLPGNVPARKTRFNTSGCAAS